VDLRKKNEEGEKALKKLRSEERKCFWSEIRTIKLESSASELRLEEKDRLFREEERKKGEHIVRRKAAAHKSTMHVIR
jgi:transposase